MGSDYILEIKNITKQFPGVKALDNVSINIKRGTVHAIVGENGAGKSTLIKILAGIYVNYEGEIFIDGGKEVFHTPNDAKVKGISVVHQELKLAEPLSVAENIFLGSPIISKSGFVDWSQTYKRAQKMVDDLKINIDVRESVSSLSVAKKQIVEICKSIAHNCKILFMDEPTATLTLNEQETLFRTIDKLKLDGVTIIYISHRLEEIFQLADEVSVLRDGKHVSTMPISEITKDSLVKQMVGRNLDVEFPRSNVTPGEVILSVKNLNRNGVLHDISFDLFKGEILGIAGLVGSGRTELIRALLGIDMIDSGEIILHGERIHHKHFSRAIKNGFGLVPEDRKQQGVTQNFSVKANICMTDMCRIAPHGIIKSKLENQYANEYSKKLRVATPSINTEVQYLSGGNQQKVVVAKWLYRDCEILIMDEPTRGIDVGAKREIYDLICELVRQGKTIIVISSEMAEVLGVSDRVLVMHEGRLMCVMNANEATQEKVMSMCT
jgi:ABC-type sugar transport system ATPase subunit